MIPIDFHFTCSKVKVNPLFSAQCVVCLISFDPFTWSIPNVVQGLPQRVDDPYWFSGHVFKGQGQTTFSAQCFFLPLHLINTKLCAGVAHTKIMISIGCQVTCSKVKVKLLFWAQCVVRIFYSLVYRYLLRTCFAYTEKLNMNFASLVGGGAYIFVKHFLFSILFWKYILKR